MPPSDQSAAHGCEGGGGRGKNSNYLLREKRKKGLAQLWLVAFVVCTFPVVGNSGATAEHAAGNPNGERANGCTAGRYFWGVVLLLCPEGVTPVL